MTNTVEPVATNSVSSGGFDAAVKSRDQDYLERWPIAKELYGIVASGPEEWSVRAAVYGEWGTGKTSVLEFIAAMSAKDEHVIVRFNPWEHSTKDALWRAFVSTVFEQLGDALGEIKGSGAIRAKEWAQKAKTVISTVTGVVNATAGKAVDASLALVKTHLSFSKRDLASLKESLNGKRVIVLIDDLDRTAPELVPEILFALKELMDIPGFAFVCAFDPTVVGKVLGQYHPGFGEGLKFLEKIIDYPRWLPPPPFDGLVRLALAESRRFCPYVPEAALRDTISLLPRNPRAVRQFIRLLALLKPQIDRHYDHELFWPVILASNVLKIRNPRVAHALLKDSQFWENINTINFMSKDDKGHQEIVQAVESNVDRVVATLEISLEPSARTEIVAALKQLCSHVNPWALRNVDFIAAQVELAEAPQAVTWKEYDSLVDRFALDPTRGTAEKWILDHSLQVERSQAQVYSEALDATVSAYTKALREADVSLIEIDKEPAKKKAGTLLALLECLVVNESGISGFALLVAREELKRLFEGIGSLIRAVSDVHSSYWPRCETILLGLIDLWTGDVGLLMYAIQPYNPNGFTHYEGGVVRALHKRLSAAVLPKFARQVVESFRESGFVERLFQQDAATFDARSMIFNPDGPMWRELQREVMAVLTEAPSNRSVQENAYELLYWCEYSLREQKGYGDAGAIALLSKADVVVPIWRAATASPLGPAAIARMQKFPDEVKKLGSTLELPVWWTAAVASFTTPEAKSPQTNNESKENAESRSNST